MGKVFCFGCLVVLALLCACSGRDGEASRVLEPSEAWFNADSASCETPDVCGWVSVHCEGLEGPGVLQGCIEGRCIRGSGFGKAYCAYRGSRVQSGSSGSVTEGCSEGERAACIACRAEQGRACNAGPCLDEADALRACAEGGFEDLPNGIERIGWRFMDLDTRKMEICDAEESRYRSCVESNCPAWAECPATVAFYLPSMSVP